MAISWWPPDRWPDNTPDPLQELCLDYCTKHPKETICNYNKDMDVYEAMEGLLLPPTVSENLVRKWVENGNPLDDQFLYIFKDKNRTKLKKLSLDGFDVSDDIFYMLMEHCPLEVDISSCYFLTSNALFGINEYGKHVRSLFIGSSTQVLKPAEETDSSSDSDDIENGWENIKQRFGRDVRLECPNLRALSVHGLTPSKYCCIVSVLLNPVRSTLVHLDLSGCKVELENMKVIGELGNLYTLILHDVHIYSIAMVFSHIAKLKKLRSLCLSHGWTESAVVYQDPEKNLTSLVKSLPDLTRLDLSGTNLSGFLKPTEVSHSLKPSEQEKEPQCAIPGLEGRYLEFLGLLNCPYEACQRPNLPAKQVTGDATEEQVITSINSYLDKTELLLRCLNNLFHMCKYQECYQQRGALRAIISAMRKHPTEKHIQISGSASLFYICKSEQKFNFTTKVKRIVIKTLIDGMEKHMEENTMVRNGCLTLCHFKIPDDVLFDYKRVVNLLLRMVGPPQSEEFVQRIGIYLLNSLACQVDGHEKQLVGDLGAIETMLGLIRERLSRENCDEVMEIAWSTMWNVTDETPVNCERFIDGEGMELFLKCLKKFPNKDELLRNMMGLLGNVAEVKELRPRLMQPKYVAVFSQLLSSSSDGIEVSYNACGVISHLMTDGAKAWTVKSPTRDKVLQNMVDAINSWQLNSRRNINYRSFEPILRLIPDYETPQAQHWAVWALCNLTKMHKSKYCLLLQKENGVILLEQVVQDPRPYKDIKDLAQQVIDRCQRFNVNESDYESSNEADGGEMDNDVDMEG